MKKILTGLLVVALLLCITACSEDQYAKIGELMGKMSGNVYGIKPNMKDVDAANEKVEDTVKTDETGKVTVEIKSEDAKAIVDSVIAVQDSTTKTEALQESLNEPIMKDATPEQKEALQEGLKKQAADSKIDTTGYTGVRLEIAEAVNQAIDAAADGISGDPTKGELATVAVLKTLADAVVGGVEYADAGLAAVNALKITTDVGKIDVFANADISALVGKLTGKDIARDNDDPGIKDYLPIMSKSATEIIKCITDAKGNFDDKRYAKFILECKAIKASYEMIAKNYEINFNTRLDSQTINGKGLVIEELGRYVIAAVFTELDRISAAGEKIWKAADPTAPQNNLRTFVNKYVTENYSKLMDLADNYDKLENPTKDDSPSHAELMSAVAALAFGIGDDPTAIGYDFSRLLDSLKKALKDSGSLQPTAITIFQVTGVILLDSEYTSLLSLGDMDGTLAGLLKKISE